LIKDEVIAVTYEQHFITLPVVYVSVCRWVVSWSWRNFLFVIH